MGDIKVGDQVCNPDGSVARVIQVFPNGAKRNYRFTFADGATTLAGDEHLWLFWQASKRIKADRRYFPFDEQDYIRGKIATTTELIRIMEQQTENMNAGERAYWPIIPLSDPVTFTRASRTKHGDQLPIHPYVLGALLGDGCLSQKRSISFTTTDDFIVAELSRLLDGAVSSRSAPMAFGIISREVYEGLQQLGLKGTKSESKFIPESYLYAGIEMRFALMQGLMDTDGYVDQRGHLSYTSVSKQLAQDFQFLARSLGAKATLTEKQGGYRKSTGERVETRIAYTIYIQGERLQEFVRLPRKRELCKPYNGGVSEPGRRIADIEDAGVHESQCIKVDHPNGLYITDDFIVTHNSEALLMAALQYVDQPDYHALLVRRSFRDLDHPQAIMYRAREWLDNTDAHWNDNDKRWTFPSGATLTFGYLEKRWHHLQYQSAEFQFIGFDELTQFEEYQFTYLFSRLRRKMGSKIPLRMRSGTNPGGPGHCVPYGEVLTPTGWKDIQCMEIGDPVYTVNSAGCLLESQVEQVHASDYTGDMMYANVRGLHIACTPNHKIAKLGGTRLKNRGELFSLTSFDELPGQTTVLRTVEWEGQALSPFSPPIYHTRKRKHQQPERISGHQFAQLLGWMLSEGFTVDRDKAFGIAQSKEIHRSTIRALLNECGFIYSESDAAFTIYAPDWWAYFRELGKCREEFIPVWVKAGASYDLMTLFTALMDGDGHWENRLQSGQYYTTSKQLADDVCEIGLKLGYVIYMSVRQRTNRNGPSYTINFKQVESGGTELLTGNHIYNVSSVTARKSDIVREPYIGRVYCIGIPEHHAFIIRQKGSIWVSGNSWVKQRYIIEGRKYGRVFIPSLISDNPHVDQAEYILSLAELDPTTREQLLAGDWDAAYDGGVFRRHWFKYMETIPDLKDAKQIRHWDLAATEPSERNPDPDWTAGCRMADLTDGKIVVIHMGRMRDTAGEVEKTVKKIAHRDGKGVKIQIEQEPGASGKSLVQYYITRVLKGFRVSGVKPGGNKETRTWGLASQAEAGNLYLVRGDWNSEFVNELVWFPQQGKHDDQVDAASGAFEALTAPTSGARVGRHNLYSRDKDGQTRRRGVYRKRDKGMKVAPRS
jgi:predicted phage terminase large subunit-like protein